MPQPRTAYIEVHFIDPCRISSDGVDAARVATLGVLMRGHYIELEGTATAMATAMSKRILRAAHAISDRAELIALRSQTTGITVLYYCSQCGGRLAPDRCARCNIRYAAPPGVFAVKQAALPRVLLDYVTKTMGHAFLDSPPRY